MRELRSFENATAVNSGIPLPLRWGGAQDRARRHFFYRCVGNDYGWRRNIGEALTALLPPLRITCASECFPHTLDCGPLAAEGDDVSS
jgi:hypothetical protein